MLTVTGDIGSVAGETYSTISNCKSKVTITGNGQRVGGIVGRCKEGKVINCINYNSISGKEYVGGICRIFLWS